VQGCFGAASSGSAIVVTGVAPPTVGAATQRTALDPEQTLQSAILRVAALSCGALCIARSTQQDAWMATDCGNCYMAIESLLADHERAHQSVRWRFTVRRDVCLSLPLSFAVTIALVPTAFAQQVTRIERITFETNVVPNRPSKPILLRALLYIPTNVELPISAVVITPSSGGVREDVEIHNASNLARSGIAALVIDSCGSRGVAHTVHDQRLVDDWQMVNDAIAGLRQLIADRRFKRDRAAY